MARLVGASSGKLKVVGSIPGPVWAHRQVAGSIPGPAYGRPATDQEASLPFIQTGGWILPSMFLSHINVCLSPVLCLKKAVENVLS